MKLTRASPADRGAGWLFGRNALAAPDAGLAGVSRTRASPAAHATRMGFQRGKSTLAFDER
jgi:hypothetical protein